MLGKPDMVMSTVFPISWILLVIVAHWIADFVCQTDKMATRKSTSMLWLSLHVLTYTVVLSMVMLVLWGHVNLFWILLNGLLHWVTDFVTSRITSQLWKMERRHDFFVMVGLDQVIHYACLFITAAIALRAGINVL
jgi:hypothetical protein